MKKILMAAMAVSWLAGGAMALRAQENAPPKVIVITRESVKVGKDAGHEKNEAAFAKALAALKRPDHYLATTTMSGPDEAVFFAGFDNYAQWGEAEKLGMDPKQEAVLGPMFEKDGDFISETHEAVATYNEKWSYHPAGDVASMRYFEIETIHLRAGRDKEWEDLVALFKATAEKVNLDESDMFFEVRYGAPDGTVLIFTPRKSLAELDTAMSNGKAFNEALGPDGQKKWAELLAACVESARMDLLEFDPGMSYPPESWLKEDPGFWKPKPMMAAKPAAEKKAEEPAKK